MKLDPNFKMPAAIASEFRSAARVEAAWPLADGAVLLQGLFTPLDASEAQRFVKVSRTSGFDFVHVPHPAEPEQARVLHAGTDNLVYVAPSSGDFIERYAQDGGRDDGFGQRKLAGGTATISAVHVDTAGRILVGGSRRFVEIARPEGADSGAVLHRLYPSGELDETFVFQNPDALSSINAVAELPGGGYAIAGSGKLAVVDQNGFVLGQPVARVYDATISQLVRTGGFTYALGEFASILGVNSRGIVRLGADGFPDPTWSNAAGADGPVIAVQSLAEGRLLITREIYPAVVLFGDGDSQMRGENTTFPTTPLFPRHAILTAEGLLDPNEDQPPPVASPVIVLPSGSPAVKTMLTATTDGMLYEFTPDGHGRCFRPVVRPAITLVSPDIVYFDEGDPLRLEVQLPSGAGASVQWFRNGELLADVSGSVFRKLNSTWRDAGVYTVRYERPGSEPVFATFRVRVNPSAGRILNVSARSFVSEGGNMQIVGFIVDGFSIEPTLLRSIQSDLKSFGIGEPAKKSTLALHVNGKRVSAPNAPFAVTQSAGALENIVRRAGAFPVSDLQANPQMLLSPNPNLNYTLHFSAAAAEAGIVLNELFLPTPVASGLYEQVPQRFVNFSCRAKVGTGERVLVAGFVIEGNRPLPVLLHGLGPTLRGFGIADATSDPVLELHRGGQLVQVSDDWSRQGDADEISRAEMRLGATMLIAGSADAALLTVLGPGAYTLTLRGKDVGENVGMIEVYDAR
jgi:hypothetical protein